MTAHKPTKVHKPAEALQGPEARPSALKQPIGGHGLQQIGAAGMSDAQRHFLQKQSHIWNSERKKAWGHIKPLHEKREFLESAFAQAKIGGMPPTQLALIQQQIDDLNAKIIHEVKTHMLSSKSGETEAEIYASVPYYVKNAIAWAQIVEHAQRTHQIDLHDADFLADAYEKVILPLEYSAKKVWFADVSGGQEPGIVATTNTPEGNWSDILTGEFKGVYVDKNNKLINNLFRDSRSVIGAADLDMVQDAAPILYIKSHDKHNRMHCLLSIGRHVIKKQIGPGGTPIMDFDPGSKVSTPEHARELAVMRALKYMQEHDKLLFNNTGQYSMPALGVHFDFFERKFYVALIDQQAADVIAKQHGFKHLDDMLQEFSKSGGDSDKYKAFMSDLLQNTLQWYPLSQLPGKQQVTSSAKQRILAIPGISDILNNLRLNEKEDVFNRDIYRLKKVALRVTCVDSRCESMGTEAIMNVIGSVPKEGELETVIERKRFLSRVYVDLHTNCGYLNTAIAFHRMSKHIKLILDVSGNAQLANSVDSGVNGVLKMQQMRQQLTPQQIAANPNLYNRVGYGAQLLANLSAAAKASGAPELKQDDVKLFSDIFKTDGDIRNMIFHMQERGVLLNKSGLLFCPAGEKVDAVLASTSLSTYLQTIPALNQPTSRAMFVSFLVHNQIAFDYGAVVQKVRDKAMRLGSKGIEIKAKMRLEDLRNGLYYEPFDVSTELHKKLSGKKGVLFIELTDAVTEDKVVVPL